MKKNIIIHPFQKKGIALVNWISMFMFTVLSLGQLTAQQDTTDTAQSIVLPTLIIGGVFDSVSEQSVKEPKHSGDSVIAFLQNRGVPVTSDNHLILLKGAQEKFDFLFEDIKQAKHHIHLEYFNFRNDSIGNALFDLLAMKVKEGVKVRALVDAFGNSSNTLPFKRKDLKAFKEKGIEIVVFDRLSFPFITYALHRDHRKIVVIDGTIGYTGGINVADYYIKGTKKVGLWHDTHIRIQGSAVKSLQQIFLSIWNSTTKQYIGGAEFFPLIIDTVPEQLKMIAIVDRTPRKNPALLRHTYVKSIEAAQEIIQIVNPYFLPPPSIKKAIRNAIKRGVKVEIMFSPKADIKFTPDGSVYAAHRLMKQGAHIYLYHGGFHHSKIMMVDNSFCTIGTTNLDGRSLRYDYEVNAFIFDAGTTQQLSEIFEADKEDCHILTNEVWRKKSIWKRFVGWTANMLTPFL